MGRQDPEGQVCDTLSHDHHQHSHLMSVTLPMYTDIPVCVLSSLLSASELVERTWRGGRRRDMR